MPDMPLTGVSLGRFTTLAVGGPADYLIEVDGAADLARWLSWATERGLDWLVLGHGSNVVIADSGIRGLVIVNRRRQPIEELVSEATAAADGWSVLSVDGGADLSRLVQWTAARGLAGLEWAAGIPGTVAGAVVGNAGAQGSSIADAVLAARLVLPNGTRLSLSPTDLAFGYRTSRLREGGVLGAIASVDFALAAGDREACQAKATEYLMRRRSGQPGGRSAGCVFGNPAGGQAGALLDRCGLKGHSHGEAVVSNEHANFVINRGAARAADVVSLMSTMRRAVHERFGIVLEPEVRLLGDVGLEAL